MSSEALLRHSSPAPPGSYVCHLSQFSPNATVRGERCWLGQQRAAVGGSQCYLFPNPWLGPSPDSTAAPRAPDSIVQPGASSPSGAAARALAQLAEAVGGLPLAALLATAAAGLVAASWVRRR